MSGKRTDWRVIAMMLADRLVSHAFCPQHSVADAVADCPFCLDRDAYRMYLAEGGRDYTPQTPEGRNVGLADLGPPQRVQP